MVVSTVQTLVQGEWECSDCGYYVSGNSQRAPLRCPDCGAKSDDFDFWPDEVHDWFDEVDSEDYEDDEDDD